MKNLKMKTVLVVAMMMIMNVLVAQETSERNLENGKKIFSSRCTACHQFERKVVGPPLFGVVGKRSEEWLVKFIRNSQEFIKAGDADAVAIFNEFNQMMMPPHSDLSEDDVKDILAYIASEEELKATASVVPEVVMPEVEEKPNVVPFKFSDYYFWGIIALLVVFITFILLLQVKTDEIIRKNKKD